MNIVFFGTSEFAIPALKALIASRHKVLAVVTQPDRKRGRQLKLSPPVTKVLAETASIPVWQPQDASGRESVQYLKSLGADLFVVIAFGQILRKEVLGIPKKYCINLHGSLLPRYRGAAPTNWAIINGDKASGVTVIRMNEKMDEGEIISGSEIAIDDEDTNITLSERLADLGAAVLLRTLDAVESGKEEFRKQEDKAATYAPKLKKEDGLIDWDESAVNIHNKVRGFLPWPGAYTHYDGSTLKVLKTQAPAPGAEKKGAVPGDVLDVVKDKGIIVRTGSGDIVIQNLQLEGKKAMDADSFVRGHRIKPGYKFI